MSITEIAGIGPASIGLPPTVSVDLTGLIDAELAHGTTATATAAAA